MKEQFVTIESEYRLKGTLTIPTNEEGNLPGILLIAGTGQGDRDGNFKGLTMNLYKNLAEYLTSIGFITLRYDKRGTHESEGNFYEAGLWDFIDDAAQCVRFLKEHPLVDPEKIIILGHSEGAIIAPAVRNKEEVAGLILLGGFAEQSKLMFPIQTEKAYEEMNASKGFKGWLFKVLKLTEKSRKQNEKFFKKVLESNKASMRVSGARVNAKWFREQYEYNVLEYLEQVTIPVLAITGDNDVQVPPEHAEKIAEYVQGESEWHIIPNMNHILRKYEKKHTMLGAIKEYKSLVNEPIDPDLLNHLESWLQRYNEVSV